MKLPKTEHTSRPWLIHDLAPDFDVEDVWALPTPGGPGDLPRLVDQIALGKGEGARFKGVAGLLFAIRWKLGAALGWDRRDAGVGTRVATLRDRLPEELREAHVGPEVRTVPFRAVYLKDDEWAAEMANRTVHTVMHIGWVPDGNGGHRGQMAVLVKPNGRFGAVYMAAIAPLRYAFVYPALMKKIRRGWSAEAGPRHAG
ncbi:DUF2867 domain-containing protein [Phytomonospora sp. NPDC050363]|uniref:DUF2867 domain-containing protein n=1 Tax=Phytomonospora sp. NPDC050363 TaxID=3155642 RepID=UPI0033CB34AC